VTIEPTDTDVRCACGGAIMRTTSRKFDGRHGPMVIGPGGRGQWHKVEHFYCGDCGISYWPSVMRARMAARAQAHDWRLTEPDESRCVKCGAWRTDLNVSAQCAGKPT
jgi:hypothetical protein